MAKGNRVRQAMVMRQAPSSSGEKTISPFLISIKEVPQIRASIITRNQASGGVPVFSGAVVVAVLIAVNYKSIKVRKSR